MTFEPKDVPYEEVPEVDGLRATPPAPVPENRQSHTCTAGVHDLLASVAPEVRRSR
jgi:hypothetical protein